GGGELLAEHCKTLSLPHPDQRVMTTGQNGCSTMTGHKLGRRNISLPIKAIYFAEQTANHGLQS
ncbi:MAG: hypothetical protein ACRCU9_06170, partial [Iodobacter sp.]